ncbi:MAG: molybdopterin cofactor synthesis protein MoaA [uncultured bacterium]|nr:MAG: molybdopterin cofactor synthesis protein MoaA [uncultured bacterium]
MGRGPTQQYYQTLNEDYVNGTLTCLKPETIKKNVNLNFPNILNIEPTNACNLKCYYCPRMKAKKGVGFMNWELFKNIIDEASKYEQLIMLNFHKDGEPFLHPKIIDMICYAKDKNVARIIHLNTNALCWNERLIDEILDSGLDDITVSLDAARTDTYMKHKGMNLLDKVEGNVRLFFERRNKLGLKHPFCRVKIMEFDKIQDNEIKEFHDKWNNISDGVQVTGIHNWSGAIKNLNSTDESSKTRFPCLILWYSLVVNWNGEVTVCSVDWDTEIKIGNVNNQSLHKIWNSDELKLVRGYHIKKDFNHYPICKDCVVWVSIGDMTEWLKENNQFYI